MPRGRRVQYRYCPACRMRTSCFENEHTDIDCSTVSRYERAVRDLQKEKRHLLDGALELSAEVQQLKSRIQTLLEANSNEVARRREIESRLQRKVLVGEVTVAALADRAINLEAKLSVHEK